MKIKIKMLLIAIALVTSTSITGCNEANKKEADVAVTKDITQAEAKSKEESGFANYITLEKEKKNSKIFNVVVGESKKKISQKDVAYQQTVSDEIEKLRKNNSYTIQNPLLIKNPYGTSLFSVNAYFSTKEAVYLEYTVSVTDGSYEDFKAKPMKNNERNITTKHQYQLIGFVPGKENKLTLTLYNKNKEKVASSSFKVTMPKSPSEAEVKLKTKTTKNKGKLTDGLFCVMYGRSAGVLPNIYFYDNNGILRAEIPIEGYRTDRILFIEDDMIYSYDDNKIARVNEMGQIVANYTFDNYVLHHDFVYDNKNNKLLMLASKSGSSTIEDMILQLDLKTAKTSLLIDLKNIMPESYKAAKKPAKKKTLDWFHANTIQLVDEKNIILSARETSSIVQINDIYGKPKLHSIISDKSVWKGTSYESVVYKKIGDFTAQAGQHTVTYVKDKSLLEGQYYLHMFNNNLAYSGTRPDISWDNYTLAKMPKDKKKSYYYKYLVDQSTKTFQLVDSFPVPYSGYVSSSQELGDNFVICSGSAFVFGEYNKDGELLKQFQFNNERHIYRTFKYTSMEVQ